MAKVALLIGVKDYAEGLKPLPAAPKDVAAMQEVLQNPEMGGFDDVKTLVNPNRSEMAVAIELWFRERQRDDLAVLFFSGHGVKDESRQLYFAACDTRKIQENLIQATAVSASFVRNCLKRCKSKRQVVILDCCFSGAFGDLLAKDDGDVDLESQLGTEGGVVLTSSSSLQYSFEQESSDLSIYTRYLVEGIRTGAADRDGDGAVSVDELHQYASRKVQTTAPAMNPKIIVLKDEGFRIRLTKAPIGDPKLKYRKEVERRVELGKFTRPARRLLKRRREQLGLSPEEADAIEAEVLQPYREHQHKLKEYEETLVEALQDENPLSDRTRKDLKDYQKYLGLSDEDAARIEQNVIPHDDLSSERGVDYSKLRDLLASGQWKEADGETTSVMLKAANQEQEGYLNIESIEKFPCTDLRTIDQLWVKYSNGRFGFSVQASIWESVVKESVGLKPSEYYYGMEFPDRIGWSVKKEWLFESDLTYGENAPEGHLPTYCNLDGHGWEFQRRTISSIALRLVSCNI